MNGVSGAAPLAKIVDGPARRFLRPRFVEDVFFLLATGFCFYYAIVIVTQPESWPQRAAGLVASWLVLAYLALPRLNQVLTSIYVPDYFIGRTRTGVGILGDPVNVGLVGSDDQIHTVMQRAKWVLADPITLRSSWGIIVSSLARRPYPSAPVSPLLLFGKPEAFAYQQEVDGSASRRHHVRFWPTPEGWLLPGGHRVDWLAAGSFDRSVGLSLFTLQVTHNVDADIDAERDHIVASVTAATPELSVAVVENFSTGYHSRNGGGDRFHTDGNLPILDLGTTESNTHLVQTVPKRRDVAARPTSVLVAVALTILTTLFSAVVVIPRLLDKDLGRALGIESGASDGVRWAVVALVALIAVGMVILAVRTYQGGSWSRIGLLGLTSFSLASHVGIGDLGMQTLAEIAVDLGIMYSLTTASARAFTGVPKAVEPS